MSSLSQLSQESTRALTQEISYRTAQFNKLSQKGKILGRWEDPTWTYKGTKVGFYDFDRHPQRSHKKYQASNRVISGQVGTILRCYIVSLMHEERSTYLIHGRIISAKILYHTLGDNFLRWSRMTKSDLEAALAEINTNYKTAASRYHRANDLKALYGYLKGLAFYRDNEVMYFLDHRFNWNHRIQNPERAREQKRLENIDSRGDKYPEGLEEAIGAVRALLKENPHLEKKSASDTLLVNTQAFCLALGLRAGELCRLPVYAYDIDARSGTGIIRSFTEKGAEPIAMPIPDIWHEPIKEAFDYLLSQSAAARERALEIEKNGFRFVSEIIERENFLSTETTNLLRDAGIAPEHLCPLELICRNFALTKKSFASEKSRYGKHVVLRPSKNAIKLANFALRLIDLLATSGPSEIYRVLGLRPKINLKRIGRAALLPNGSILNTSWITSFICALSEKLWELYLIEDSIKTVCSSRRNILRSWLAQERENFLKVKAPNAGALINYKSWIEQLKEEYSSYLARHYHENCDKESLAPGSFSYQISSSSFSQALPLSDHLIVVWDEELNGNTKCNGILPRPLFLSDIYNWLSTKGGKLSVFERYNILDKSGKIYCISNHQIRHWLTTALLRSGPSEMMTNLWMGRKAQQLRSYDHRTPKERAEFIRSKSMYFADPPPADWLGRKVAAMRASLFSENEITEFVESRLSILHFTPWGYCSRDLTLSPCSKGLMCLKGFGENSGCSNFHIDPTDLVAKAKITETLNNYRLALLALEPKFEILQSQFLNELDESQTLDQHLVHVYRVIKGCETALDAYNNVSLRSSESIVKVFEDDNRAEKRKLACKSY